MWVSIMKEVIGKDLWGDNVEVEVGKEEKYSIGWKLLDYWKSITTSKVNIMETGFNWDGRVENDYEPFHMNRNLSYHLDCVYSANEMNGNCHLPHRLQFDYFINTIEKGYLKLNSWVKPTEIEDLESVKEYYKYGNIRAKEALGLLSRDQLLYIKCKLRKGGMNK